MEVELSDINTLTQFHIKYQYIKKLLSQGLTFFMASNWRGMERVIYEVSNISMLEAKTWTAPIQFVGQNGALMVKFACSKDA
jgi:hypothetical protein